MRELTVAIADPYPMLREGLVACVESASDLRVIGVAATGREVFDLVEAQRPDILVVDSEFADPDGMELIRHVAEMRSHPAIVVLGREEHVENALEAVRAGASAFVSKVAPVEDLVSAIRWTGRGEMWIAPPLLRNLFERVKSRNSSHDRAKLANLSERELEVLELMVDGLGLTDIASRLHLAVNTVRTHASNIQGKLNVHSNLAAVSVALQEGLRPQ